MLFIEIILPVFLIILSGYALEKTFKLDSQTFTLASLYLFAPALVLSALLEKEFKTDLALDILVFMILYTAILYALSFAGGKILKMDRDCSSALSLTTSMMNVGNFGLPLALFAFGTAALDTAVLTFVLFNIPLGTLAIIIAQGEKASIWKSFVNTAKIPIFHAVALALLLQFAGIDVPESVLRPIGLLGQAAVPVMLVLLGMQIAQTKLAGSVGFISLSAFLRLIVSPLVALALAAFLGIKGLDHDILVLQTSTPAAVLPLLYSVRFGTRPDLVASAIVMTTFLSAFTLTALLYFLK